jgi:hypothetical protein
MKKKRRRMCGLFGVMVTLSLLAGQSRVFAATESPLQMQAQVGWDGVFKAKGWTTMTVTLANKGANFQGHVSVEATDASQGNVVFGSIEKTVVVPAGKAQAFTLEVPGSMFNYPVNIEVTDAAGKQVLVQSKTTYQPVRQGLLIGGLVRNEAELNLFPLLSGMADFSLIRVKLFTKADIPTKPELLEGLDMLELNSAEQSQLSPAQVRAIHQWVEGGGHLLLSGSAAPTATDALADRSPVQVTGTSDVSDLAGLRAMTGEKLNVDSLHVHTGKLQTGATSLADAEGVPLLVRRTVGRGGVLYAAYDLGAEPLASWQGNKVLWSKVLRTAGLTTEGEIDPNNLQASEDQNKRTLIVSSGSFLKLAPSTALNLAIFTGYLLLIGPLLFWLLRRAKKQTLAWVLVPSTAVVAAVAIYAYGTESRSGGAFAQMHSQIRLQSEQRAEVDGAATFIVENGGTYSVQIAPGMRAFTTKANYADNDWGNGDNVQQDGTQAMLNFRNVDYWSPRGAFLSGELSGTGMVQSDLHIDGNGHLIGTLTNKTSFDLDHVFVGVGAEPVAVPDLKKGQTVKIDALLHDNVAHAWNGNENDSMVMKMFPPDRSKRDPYGEFQPQRSVVGYAITPQEYGSAPIQLFAFTEAPLNLFRYMGANAMQTSNFSLVRQDLTWHLDAQGAKVPMGLIKAKVVKATGDVQPNDVKLTPLEYDQGFNMLNGQLTLDYDLHVQPGFVPEQVRTDLDQAVYSSLDKQLYNWHTHKWVAASSDNTPVLSGEALKPYVSPDGHLHIRLTAARLGNMTMMSFPHVGVTGKGGGR